MSHSLWVIISLRAGSCLGILMSQILAQSFAQIRDYIVFPGLSFPLSDLDLEHGQAQHKIVLCGGQMSELGEGCQVRTRVSLWMYMDFDFWQSYKEACHFYYK